MLFTRKLFITILTFIIILILFGAILNSHYHGSLRFQFLQKIAVFTSEIPKNIKFIFLNRTITGDIVLPINEIIYNEKKFFNKKINSAPNREELIIISRHDPNINRSIVEIRDLNTFQILHSYLPDIESIYQKIDFSKSEFKNLKKDMGYNKFYMWHPKILLNGDLIFQSESPLVKINYDGKIIWVNDNDIYHHSINLDLDGNIYVPSYMQPYSKKVSKFIGKESNTPDNNFFKDDAINILDKDGEIIFSKSVSEILIENDQGHRVFSQSTLIVDPIHLNDIEPVLKNGPYFKKGDVFLSLRNLSLVLLYRPEINKIIRVIEGTFFNQHDVDILDEKTISIYNNNVTFTYPENPNFILDTRRKVNENNEIVIYDFETNSFSKKFIDTFKKYQIDTDTHGLVDYLNDGSAIVEDSNNGRIFYLNKNGEVIWIFNNLSSKKQIYKLWWSRIISAKKSIELKKLINSKNLKRKSANNTK